MLNSRTAALVNNERMKRQFLDLERKVVRGGRDTVDHPRGMHDDVSNAVAGVLVHAKLVPAASSVPGFNRKLDLPRMAVA